ncbi:MAG: hypothetical protein ICV63_18395 [Coleofasciculus sp. Co-bin14]|nr:hypothetical protein [Coleofasciculus sp. Co-bin14]
MPATVLIILTEVLQGMGDRVLLLFGLVEDAIAQEQPDDYLSNYPYIKNIVLMIEVSDLILEYD